MDCRCESWIVLIKYRPFLNTDLPAVVDLWRKMPQFRRLSSTLSGNDLEQRVLSKPYFDPQGFIVAEVDGVTSGFVHAGFGPDAKGGNLDFTTGILCQLRALEIPQASEIRTELIQRACLYLSSKGALRCFSASRFPDVPFYLGLYGGSRIPGVPQEDETLLEALETGGFREHDRILIFQRSLNGYRSTIDRQAMHVRRRFQVQAIIDPTPATWWENCMLGMAETHAFRLLDRNLHQPVGSVTFWEIQPLSMEWGVRSMGMCNLEIDPSLHQQGLGTFLVGQALTQLAEQSVGLCEVQVRASNVESIKLFDKLGFEQVSYGLEMVKDIN